MLSFSVEVPDWISELALISTLFPAVTQMLVCAVPLLAIKEPVSP